MTVDKDFSMNDEKGAPVIDLSRIESCRPGEIHLSEEAGTKRNIKSRHAQMIAIGGTIGTGLFVGSGQALSRGGPAFLLLAYCLVTFLVSGQETFLSVLQNRCSLRGKVLYCSMITG